MTSILLGNAPKRRVAQMDLFVVAVPRVAAASLWRGSSNPVTANGFHSDCPIRLAVAGGSCNLIGDSFLFVGGFARLLTRFPPLSCAIWHPSIDYWH